MLTLMASKSKASIPDLHMTVSDGMTISLEDPKACEVCHKVYSRCVASVLLGSLPPDAAALKNIDTCKTIELEVYQGLHVRKTENEESLDYAKVWCTTRPLTYTAGRHTSIEELSTRS